MNINAIVTFFCYALGVCCALILTHDSPHKVVKILQVGNGDRWGSWERPEYCAAGHFGIGYSMKIEGSQGSNSDDSSMNGISLKCASVDGVYGGSASSGVGPWGSWTKDTNCENGEAQKVLTAFVLQVESDQGSRDDDTAANYIKFKCRDINIEPEYELTLSPGHGPWGSYGDWSGSCPLKSAICGIQTRIESPQGSDDDTALNDVKFFCCSE